MVYRSMTHDFSSLARLSDNELLAQVRALAAHEREATARLIASLAEVDARRLYLGEGCSSLFTYCTQVLRLSEHAAYGRIEAARAARRFPIVLERLADGSLTLTTVCLLAPLLTAPNHRDVLRSARHKSKREVEQIVACLRPLPAVASTVRKLPARTSSPSPVATAFDPAPASCVSATASSGSNSHARADEASPTVDRELAMRAKRPAATRPSPAVIAPLAPERYRIQFTMSGEMHDRLQRAQDLLRHVVPNGDPAAIFDRALTMLVRELERTKVVATDRPKAARSDAPLSRRVPANVRREVWKRDGGRCAFVGTSGRCTERGFLQYHHVVPYAAGGPTTSENLELRCASHNRYEAELWFGPMLARETRPLWAITRSGPSYVLWATS